MAHRSSGDASLDSITDATQREEIVRALSQVAGNKAAAARVLGISRRSLYRYIERLEIP